MKKALLFSLLLVATFLSSGLPRVSAPAILITPMDTTINVASNETFALAYKMRWDEPDPGFFSATVYWDCADTTPNLNFTYVGFVCKFTNGTNVPGVEWSFTKKTPTNATIPRYILQHRQTAGVWGNGEFLLNVTMKAAGVINGVYTSHAEGDQNIVISKVRCNEFSTTEVGPGPCTIHVSVERVSSTISINVNPATVTVDSNVTINGTITPTRANVNVTIRYRLLGETWTTLKTVKTDSNGQYTHTWKTSKTGTYEIKASWPGDPNTLPAESETKTVKVEAQPLNIVPYVMAGTTAVIIVAAILIYFVKIRKH